MAVKKGMQARALPWRQAPRAPAPRATGLPVCASAQTAAGVVDMLAEPDLDGRGLTSIKTPRHFPI
jgi:hypothetical protein